MTGISVKNAEKEFMIWHQLEGIHVLEALRKKGKRP